MVGIRTGLGRVRPGAGMGFRPRSLGEKIVVVILQMSTG